MLFAFQTPSRIIAQYPDCVYRTVPHSLVNLVMHVEFFFAAEVNSHQNFRTEVQNIKKLNKFLNCISSRRANWCEVKSFNVDISQF